MDSFSSHLSPQNPEAGPEFIEVGQIVNAHGVHGDVKLQPWDVSPEQICSFQTFYLDGIPFRPLHKRVMEGKNMVLMHLPEVETMDAALALKGKLLSIRLSEVSLPKGIYFDAELIGMRVYELFPRRYVGVVEQVDTYPAHKLYRVKGEKHTYLIPAVEDVFIIEVDRIKREIYVKMMEGLAIDEN